MFATQESEAHTAMPKKQLADDLGGTRALAVVQVGSLGETYVHV